MHFAKYHGLGNIYLVIEPFALAEPLGPEAVQTICHPHFGVGADGILLGPLPSQTCDFGVQIVNPDGSPAEKSGNGLRIFARYLLDTGRVGHEPFAVETVGGPVTCKIAADNRSIQVEIGQVRFQSTEIPVSGPPREVLDQPITVADRTFRFCAATVGNPHCVILLNEAPTAVALKLGLCESSVTVHMPGGKLAVSIDDDLFGTITGPVTKICEGRIAGEMFWGWTDGVMR